MRHRDDVTARMGDVDALDCTADAVIEIHETLAAGRRLVDLPKPGAADRLARQERRAVHALVFAEMLLGKCRLMWHRCGLGESRSPDRRCGLMRPLQRACDPDPAPRQYLCDRLEHHPIACMGAD